MNPYIEKVNKQVETECQNMFQTLNAEFIQLKYKAARCAQKCFQLMNLPEAFECEKECMKSIPAVETVVKAQSEAVSQKFTQCIERVESMLEGTNEETEDLESAVASCYQQFTKDLAEAKQKVVEEFGYYE